MSINKPEQFYVGSPSWYVYWSNHSKDEPIKENVGITIVHRIKVYTYIIEQVADKPL